MKLNFVLKSIDDLDNLKKNNLVELYRSYYEKVYGSDAFDVFLKVTNISSKYYINDIDNIKDIATNFNNAINSISNNLDILFIYDSDYNLLGCSRIKNNNDMVDILDIVMENDFETVIKYIEEYYKVHSYYLNIPVSNPKLLMLASKLGYVEYPEDMYSDQIYRVRKEL